MNGLIIYLVFILYYHTSTCYGLRWSRSGVPLSYKTIHLKTTTDIVNLDVSYTTQITIVRDLQQWNYTLTIHCFITGFNNKGETDYSFCKNNDPCFNFNEQKRLLPFKEYNLEGIIETTFVDKKGFTIKLQIPNKYEDVSGNYFCKASSNKIVIQSNYIEIRDVFFWERKIFTKVESSYKSSIKTITMENIPTVLNCSDGNSMINTLMPVWAKSQFRAPVSWSVCPVLTDYNKLTTVDKMSTEKCLSYTGNKCDDKINSRICPRELGRMSGWQYYVNVRGDLILTDLPLENTNTGDTYLLMCYTKSVDDDLQAISYFLNNKNDATIESGISIDGGQRKFTQKLEAISPLIQNIILYERQASSNLALEPVALYGLYKSSSDVSFQWKFNSLNINSNNVMTVSKYMIVFDKEINFNQAGKYTLEVVDKADKLTLEINVKVLGRPVPVIDSCMPGIIYAWVNYNVEISCEYQLRPTALKLLINSQEIQFNDSLPIRQSQLKSSYPYLSDLYFNITPTEFQEADSIKITYSSFNLRKTIGHGQYQDHSVTFLASNAFGLSLKSTSIYVLPPLKAIVNNFPDTDNCTNACSSSQTHKFRCDVRVEEYSSKELVVDHFWTLHGERLGSTNTIYGRYFHVDPNTKELTLYAILSSNPVDMYVKNMLNNTWVECHVNTWSVNVNDSDFRYFSSNDKDIGERMRARIVLDNAGISQASFHWIIGLILGIILIVVVIVVIMLYRNKKGREDASRVRYNRAKEIEG